MANKIQAIRGMNDVLPDKTGFWRALEQIFIACLGSYGYKEIRFPLVESTQLFKRTIGEITDIVEKEMYTFADLNGDSLTLRPEGTASCVRACLEHGLLHNQQQKLWYMGPMFRHERPQKGRYRQFTQFGVEAFGMRGVGIELELISLCRTLWQKLGFLNEVHLEVNTLGEASERQQYKNLLVEYFSDHRNSLDEDSQRRLTRNPLRILDSKNPEMRALIQKAPSLFDVLGEQSQSHFDEVTLGLKTLGIKYTVNPSLVRGLDYYGHTVFEWVTDKLGSQATVCAGGRYDGLVEQLGGQATPAVGFALGIERILLLMETLSLSFNSEPQGGVFIIPSSPEALIYGLNVAEQLRHSFPNELIEVNTAGGGFKSQFKKADKSGARWALILGEDEMAHNKLSLKDLRQQKEQVTLDRDELISFLQRSK